MSSNVIKMLPDNLCYVGKIENWLSDMASRGLYLETMRSRHAVFKKDKPAEKKYCINELPEYPNDEQMKKYSDAHWRLTCRINTLFGGEYSKRGSRLYVFETDDYSMAKPPIEVFGDRKELYERYRAKKNSYIYYLLAALAAIVAAFVNVSEHYMLFLPSVFATIAILFLILAALSANERKHVVKTEKENELLGKLSDNDWEKSKKSTKNHMAFKIACWILIFAQVIYVNYAFLAAGAKNDLDALDRFVTLEEIQEVENNIGTTYGAFTPSLFTPYFYIGEEAGAVYDDSGLIRLIQYNIVYSRCIVPYAVSIASRNCVLMRIIDSTGGGHVVFTDSKYFSKVTYTYIYSEGEYSIKMCLANKHEIIYLIYKGDRTAQDIIEAIENKLYK